MSSERQSVEHGQQSVGPFLSNLIQGLGKAGEGPTNASLSTQGPQALSNTQNMHFQAASKGPRWAARFSRLLAAIVSCLLGCTIVIRPCKAPPSACSFADMLMEAQDSGPRLSVFEPNCWVAAVNCLPRRLVHGGSRNRVWRVKWFDGGVETKPLQARCRFVVARMGPCSRPAKPELARGRGAGKDTPSTPHVVQGISSQTHVLCDTSTPTPSSFCSAR